MRYMGQPLDQAVSAFLDESRRALDGNRTRLQRLDAIAVVVGPPWARERFGHSTMPRLRGHAPGQSGGDRSPIFRTLVFSLRVVYRIGRLELYAG